MNRTFEMPRAEEPLATKNQLRVESFTPLGDQIHAIRAIQKVKSSMRGQRLSFEIHSEARKGQLFEGSSQQWSFQARVPREKRHPWTRQSFERLGLIIGALI